MDYRPPGSSVHGTLQQEYWSGLPHPLPWDLPNPGIEPASLMSPALAGGFFTTSTTWEAHTLTVITTESTAVSALSLGGWGEQTSWDWNLRPARLWQCMRLPVVLRRCLYAQLSLLGTL